MDEKMEMNKFNVRKDDVFDKDYSDLSPICQGLHRIANLIAEIEVLEKTTQDRLIPVLREKGDVNRIENVAAVDDTGGTVPLRNEMQVFIDKLSILVYSMENRLGRLAL